jgi:hypothetical protein
MRNALSTSPSKIAFVWKATVLALFVSDMDTSFKGGLGVQCGDDLATTDLDPQILIDNQAQVLPSRALV